jgi:hypothetical protein
MVKLKNAIQLFKTIHSSMDFKAKVEDAQSERYVSLGEFSNAADRKTRAKVWNEAAQLLDNAIKLIETEEE